MTLTPPSNIAPATVAVVGPVAVTGPLTDVQLRASAVPISAAALPLPTGAAKDSTLTDGTQRVGGTVSVNVGNFPADQFVHFTTPITVDASGFTVPVSGPLTNAQLRASDVGVDGSAHTQPISAAALPLPAGAATEATLATLATAAGQAALTAALAGLSTEETLAAVNEAINDVALTAIIEREKVEP